jgi:hypothetical protein
MSRMKKPYRLECKAKAALAVLLERERLVEGASQGGVRPILMTHFQRVAEGRV